MIVDGGGLAGRQCGRAVINCGCGGMTMGIGKGKVNRIRWPAFCGPTCRSCPASLQGPPTKHRYGETDTAIRDTAISKNSDSAIRRVYV
jgi:hypothetical protein